MQSFRKLLQILKCNLYAALVTPLLSHMNKPLISKLTAPPNIKCGVIKKKIQCKNGNDLSILVHSFLDWVFYLKFDSVLLVSAGFHFCTFTNWSHSEIYGHFRFELKLMNYIFLSSGRINQTNCLFHSLEAPQLMTNSFIFEKFW